MGQISNRLTEYCKSDFYAFHMPGHKRNDGPTNVPYQIDITEIEGFDNLHQPEELLQTLPNRICKIYQCNHAWVSMNGSTGGILMAIAAFCKAGDTLLMARNCHPSVYHAAEIRGLKTTYLFPKHDLDVAEIAGAIAPEDVKYALELNPKVRTVVITSPTYEGICSDVETISKVVHEYGAKLIVDGAHGAHLGFADALPGNPISQGADVVVMSLHKTLSALTQTAIVCANVSEEEAEQLQRFYDIFMSSSPSYPMMCSVEHCLDELEGDLLQEKFATYLQRLKVFRNECEKLGSLQLFAPRNYITKNAFDLGKLVILTSNVEMTGPELMETLREQFHLELEMASTGYALAMTSLYDTQEGFDRLWQALKQIDGELSTKRSDGAELEKPKIDAYQLRPISVMGLGEAMDAKSIFLPMEDAVNQIASGYIYAYPPGIPILAPGERITKELIDAVEKMLSQNVNICGIKREGAHWLVRCIH